MTMRYYYYVRHSVFDGNRLITVGASELSMTKKISSLDDIEEIIGRIKEEEEIEDDDFVVVDFYHLLRREKIE